LPFAFPRKRLAIVFAAAFAAVVAKAAYVQVAESGPIMGHGTLVLQADGMRRFQYNPRFLDAIERIPKGSIYDRNGLPLATSDWNELEKHRAEYRELGIDIDAACSRTEFRHYPFGGLLFDLLGDLAHAHHAGPPPTRPSSSAIRPAACAVSTTVPPLVDVKEPSGAMERVIRYDYRELVPLIRHHFDPRDPAVRRVLDRPRDVHASVDARFEIRVAAILRHAARNVRPAEGRRRGARSRQWRFTRGGEPAARARCGPGECGVEAGSQSVSRPRPFRPLSARLDIQSGDGHGGAAQRSLR
jgi:hypothetical protein